MQRFVRASHALGCGESFSQAKVLCVSKGAMNAVMASPARPVSTRESPGFAQKFGIVRASAPLPAAVSTRLRTRIVLVWRYESRKTQAGVLRHPVPSPPPGHRAAPAHRTRRIDREFLARPAPMQVPTHAPKSRGALGAKCQHQLRQRCALETAATGKATWCMRVPWSPCRSAAPPLKNGAAAAPATRMRRQADAEGRNRIGMALAAGTLLFSAW